MKRIFPLLFFLAAATGLAAQTATYIPTPENLAARKAFAEKRLGIFLHWGIYSTFAQGEWFMTNENIDAQEYAKAADAFYPHRFDARQWIAAFKEAGAKYICFTTRHHDGFSMWNTAQSPYNIMHTPYGRDVLRDLADECHSQGMGLHLYYSHIDWTRQDYPRGRTGRGTGWKGKADWQGYYAFMNAQLTELLTNYGKVDAIWFDGWWDHDEDSVAFDWQLDHQYALIHHLQPACLVGNNHHQTPFPGEDIQIFERDVPGENTAGLSGQEVGKLPLETCQTMNGMWGYKVKDQNYKPVKQLIRLLVRTAGKGANLLLNIGPQPNGELPAAALERLKGMGAWLKQYGETIYGTAAGGYETETFTATRTADRLFLHFICDSLPQSQQIAGLKKVRSVRCLADGKPIPFKFDKKAGTLSLDLSGIGALKADEPDFIVEIVDK